MTNETSLIHHPNWIHEMNGKKRTREKKTEMKSKTNTNEKKGGKEQEENQAIQVKNLVHM